MALTQEKFLIFLATAPLAEIVKVFRCGFELETRKCSGLSLDNMYRTLNGGNFHEAATFFKKLHTHSKVEFAEDGSVPGPEIRTKGPLSVVEFRNALQVITKNKLEVSANCSFHIHTSFTNFDVRAFKQTPAFIEFLQHFLLMNFNKMPEKVQERLKNRDASRWFLLGLSNGRTFANVSGRHPTIEFRCWGNVSSYKDGMACLKLTLEAYRYAARCALGLITKESDLYPLEITLEGKTPNDYLNKIESFKAIKKIENAKDVKKVKTKKPVAA